MICCKIAKVQDDGFPTECFVCFSNRLLSIPKQTGIGKVTRSHTCDNFTFSGKQFVIRAQNQTSNGQFACKAELLCLKSITMLKNCLRMVFMK